MKEGDLKELEKSAKLTNEIMVNKWAKFVINRNSWVRRLPEGRHWEAEVVIGLSNRLFEEITGLQADKRDTPPDTFKIAWRSRNLLELYLIATSISRDPQRGRFLYEDKGKDLLDMLAHQEAWAKAVGDAIQIDTYARSQDELKNIIKEKGIALEGKFRSAREMAISLNIEPEYKPVWKILSKLVHPTAFSVLLGREELRRFDIFALHQANIAFQSAFIALEAIIEN